MGISTTYTKVAFWLDEKKDDCTSTYIHVHHPLYPEPKLKKSGLGESWGMFSLCVD